MDDRETSHIGLSEEKWLQHGASLPSAAAGITRYDIFPVQLPHDIIAVHPQAPCLPAGD